MFATLELGRIAERLGDRRKAAECYGFVMAAWHRSDRELLPYVAEAREGLARLILALVSCGGTRSDTGGEGIEVDTTAGEMVDDAG